MKSWLWRGMLAAAIALPAVSGVARADDNNNKCSDATLQGDYAFSVTSFTPLQFVVGIKTFDGKGNLKQMDYIGDSLRTRNQTDFAIGETGTYKVNADCTGTMVINLNAIGVPPNTTQGGVINIVFVISNGGRAIHEVVSEFTPPGASGPVPTQTRADDWMVGSEQGN
jgi:hypothetical protein